MAITTVNRLQPVEASERHLTAVRNTIEPETLDQIMTFAAIAMKSGYFGVRNVEEAAVRILYGKEMGMSVMQSMMGITIIQGRPGMSAGTIAAKVKNSGKYDYKVTKWDEKLCEIQFLEHGKPVGRSVFTIEDAKRAGLWKACGGWDKYPRSMLFARACTQGARAYAPDIFLGPIYLQEELLDGYTVEASDYATIEMQAQEFVPETIAEPEQAKPKRSTRVQSPTITQPETVVESPHYDGPIVPFERAQETYRPAAAPSQKGEIVQSIDKWIEVAEREYDKRGYPDMTAPGRTIGDIYNHLAREGMVSGNAKSYRPQVNEIAMIADNWEAIREYLKAAGKAVEKDLLDPPQ